MSGLDVINIGAVNYDYMFHCTREDIVPMDEGSESLGGSAEEIERDVTELAGKHRKYTTQLGGSALITLRVTKCICPEYRVGYVGVCGEPALFDLRYGRTRDLQQETSFIDDRRWFFHTDNRFDRPENKAIAQSVVRLYNHTRNCIRIAPNANNTLLERIRERERNTGTSLSDYLAEARWVHLSSLSDFEQFAEIFHAVAEASVKNPALKVSMDPGFAYTSVYRKRLQPMLGCCDYVFLNSTEKKNLGGGAEGKRELYSNLRDYLAGAGALDRCTLVVKYNDHHEVLNFPGGKSSVRTIFHQELHTYELNNDTGAGDSFAGGFIAGMLMPALNRDVTGPVHLGTVAARGRMLSFDYEDPYENIAADAGKFIRVHTHFMD